MNYVMTSRQHRQQIKRFWFCQKRVFVMPVSDKQVVYNVQRQYPGV